MGKVRQSVIKRVAYQIFQQYADRVSLDYAQNKKLILEVSTIRAKHFLNRVAGYLTRLANRHKKAEPQSPPQSEVNVHS
ncbi:MAG: 30S ribosomal protein S17e [Candidatus Nezhaarchaeota archaeon]|nr:30S ribosomal protein S17e [Candidatus Nezhaarchaeota archaeon]MCX8141908.1 30S ribosomal protein S17e [Candidatus Nezhaarchaeota archaeon]MDW8050311.1 30S ribosomal protein S17e [Nitrososphaerota archaeon]